MTSAELYPMLRSQFTSAEATEQWLHKWRDDDEGIFATWRAMSYHVSNVLEGYLDDPNENEWMCDYLRTPYGFIVYDVIGGGRFGDWKKGPTWPLPTKA